MEWLPWIEASAVARALSLTPGLYPLVSGLHILGIALLVGPILVADVAILRGRPAGTLPLRRVATAGFALAATTGALLFSTQAAKYAGNPAFLAKMALIGLAGANLAAFAAFSGRAFALVSLVLWVLVIFAGRWIAFVD